MWGEGSLAHHSLLCHLFIISAREHTGKCCRYYTPSLTFRLLDYVFTRLDIFTLVVSMRQCYVINRKKNPFLAHSNGLSDGLITYHCLWSKISVTKIELDKETLMKGRSKLFKGCCTIE